MPRIVNELAKYPNRFIKKDIPKRYTLNKGHVKFFRDKIFYLFIRHDKIRSEMIKRGMKVNSNWFINYQKLPPKLLKDAVNNWNPTEKDHMLNIERLCDRFDARKKPYTFYGKKIDCDHTFNEYLRTLEFLL